jgi:acyl-CoA thioester hydrolase
MQKRIHYHDTDCGGIVYYANYLKYLEEARTEYFENCGYSVKALHDKGFMFVVIRQEIDYKYPARYDDVLDIETKIEEISEIKVVFSYEIKNQESRLTTKAKTTLVCVDPNVIPCAIPTDIRENLKKETAN